MRFRPPTGDGCSHAASRVAEPCVPESAPPFRAGGIGRIRKRKRGTVEWNRV
jgi:hypothetical protein